MTEKLNLVVTEGTILTCVEFNWQYAIENPTRNNWGSVHALLDGMWTMALFASDTVTSEIEQQIHLLQQVAFKRYLDA